MAEAGQRQQAERSDRQPLPGCVSGPALQGPRRLQEQRGEAADSESGGHHHLFLFAAPVWRGHLHLRIHHVPSGEPRKHRQPHGLRWGR